MGKYLKEFELTSQYEEYINSTMALLPNVSLINDNNMIHYNPKVVSNIIPNYMRFTVVEDSVIKLTGMNGNTGESVTDADIQYSMDGKNWNQYEYVGISLTAGETLYMKGNNPNGLSIMDMNTGGGIVYMFGDIMGNGNGSTGKFECHGNIMSLIYGDDFEGKYTIPSAGCFAGLFMGCTGLTTAPELPATMLAAYCYQGLFMGCTGLTTAPELPATTLPEYCYDGMFQGCTSLNNITMLATNISASDCLNDWVSGVASTGTFIKHINMTSLPTGVNGIPEGWEVKNHITPTECTNLTITADDVTGNNTTTVIYYTATCNGVDYKGDTITGFVVEGTTISAEFLQNTSETETIERTITFEFLGVTASTTIIQGVWINVKQQYLTIEALEDDLTASLSVNACEYCIDEDYNWVTLAAETSSPSLNAGQTISFRGNFTPSSSNGIGTFTISKKCNVLGNVMSMLFGDDAQNNFSLSGKDYAFKELFARCTTIISAKDLYLPATTLAYYCYGGMFSGCKSLTTAPELPATTLAAYCYSQMFYNCTSLTQVPTILPATDLPGYCYNQMFAHCESLTTAPALPATTLVNDCYNSMFRGCSSLTAAPELPATMLAGYCYNYMFYDCTSLTQAPKLPATTLSYGCYRSMFEGCTSLVIAPELPATTLAKMCYNSMFYGCDSLTTAPELPATTLADSCYEKMFYKCTSLTTAPELPATMLAGYCYNYMFYGCTSLSYVKMLATDISASSCLNKWVSGVASTGTFVKHKNINLPTGVNGIPSGWTVQDAEI